jgi:hypothetical protein
MNANSLTACSLCLRVLRGSEWLEAEVVIRELRSFALPSLPQLESAVCTHCVEAIRGRRMQTPEPIAA